MSSTLQRQVCATVRPVSAANEASAPRAGADVVTSIGLDPSYRDNYSVAQSTCLKRATHAQQTGNARHDEPAPRPRVAWTEPRRPGPLFLAGFQGRGPHSGAVSGAHRGRYGGDRGG